jgi:hypothetical protein
LIALASAAMTPASGRSHHHQQSGPAAYANANGSYAALRDRNDVPWVPFSSRAVDRDGSRDEQTEVIRCSDPFVRRRYDGAWGSHSPEEN